VEDLGGGLSAGFHLEAQLFTDNGTGNPSNTNNQAAVASAGGGQGILFNRRSTVSLMGPWGEFRTGRDFVPQYYNIAAADTMNNTGVGAGLTFTNAITGSTLIRASNAMHYFTPSGLGGFSAHVAYFLGENASNVANKDDGSGYGVRVRYAAGPFTASIATSQTKMLAGNIRQSNAYADWNFGPAKVVVGISRDRNGALHGDGRILGVQAPFGAHTVRAAYSVYETNAATNPEARKLAFQWQYDFSKRTAVYATVAHVSNSGGSTTALNGSTTAANSSSKGWDLGIRHNF